MIAKAFGVDCSHHQSPKAMPWAMIAETSSFAIVRANYGVMKDRVTAEHMERARDAGLAIGTYIFYRPSQPWRAQFESFVAHLDTTSYADGDILPALDIEADPVPKPGTPVSPSWQHGVRSMLDAMVEEFGGAIVYITQREFGHLGKPEWLLEFPGWNAHYTAAAKPATPGNRPWLIWQHRVGAYDPAGPGGYFQAPLQLDQNRISGPLPRIGESIQPEAEDDSDPDFSERLALLRQEHIEETMEQVRSDRDRDVALGDDE